MIWLIGGTSESIAITKSSIKHEQKIIIFVTTAKATQLYQFVGKQKIFVRKLTKNMMLKFIQQNSNMAHQRL
ncbi:precorrin-6A/cobalt-precorrin-6A reductase [Geminocystis sp. NIES-3708]|uniref:precorrin-6A/cobalt-precorrin-6A reductase n=1 Tax=Geminocystis sp. NIES-3708 TaxID=1615909 RepID=UPI0011876DA2